ncbi:tRNA (adenosine(37)-N6)-dimethylallyltransferase MiaA [Cyclobacterium marinum]|uniref:tRNA dimethylallyltransferase n=1 Tax=Cyclobacterium marinum (strain ATCC 25205 / DSM 745 / LMG 13164 / NCIMB 1802) TaxID=880070 RepID=G0IXW9_CYCMS|nr:tRNA (adenosine(37)-N6)-dimethylallyltransferase MiaA [Cyclobacterium marinum]AEL24302.1 tRNA dimethylallyltransferase [Cyclobacterium marinum DSM 745]MBI0399005.1 tRNA (adenosine(37)-N6)-dimethylallyltransferase MiaA [Cyclobacterium marinum]MBR9775637.1 tRNA (adenosine(37)-N6)-dimethylallyltransferase MiaA [Cytophagales bacterium]
MTPFNKIILVIAGPTAVGKTDLCINLAKKFNTVIISSDSRQFFQEINIGTAKPSKEELDMVPHFFIGNKSIHEPYDVRSYEVEALSCIGDLFKEKDLLLLTGGSGLYTDAVINGLDDMPKIAPEIRQELNLLYAKEGIFPLQEMLKKLDPNYYGKVDLQNPQRLIRALEVCQGTGRKYSDFRVRKKVERPFKTIKIALNRDREELYSRIDRRMDKMIAEGLFEEAEKMHPYKNRNALNTVGYKEIFGYLEGEYDREEAIRLLKRNSRRYAKRQVTWLKRDEAYHWFHPDDVNGILSLVHDQRG